MEKGNYFTNLPTWAKGTIAVGLTVGLIYAGYKIYTKITERVEENKEETKEGGQVSSQLVDSFNNIPTLFGAGAKLNAKRDAYSISLTVKSVKYFFLFYSNGRIVILKANGTTVAKGKYFESGKIIILDNGKSFQYNSVWANVNNVINGL